MGESPHSTRLVTAVWTPGAVSANTDFDLPSYYPDIEEVLGGSLNDVATTTSVTATALTAVKYAASLSAGQISNHDGNSVLCGTAVTDKMMVVVVYRAVS